MSAATRRAKRERGEQLHKVDYLLCYNGVIHLWWTRDTCSNSEGRRNSPALRLLSCSVLRCHRASTFYFVIWATRSKYYENQDFAYLNWDIKKKPTQHCKYTTWSKASFWWSHAMSQHLFPSTSLLTITVEQGKSGAIRPHDPFPMIQRPVCMLLSKLKPFLAISLSHQWFSPDYTAFLVLIPYVFFTLCAEMLLLSLLKHSREFYC